MTIKGRLVENMAIFRVSLPLIQNEEFKLLGVHAIPWANQNNVSLNILSPTFPYFMVTLHKDQFCPLSDWEFSNCKTIEGDAHLCQPTHPVYKDGSAVGLCEMQLYNQHRIDKMCIMIPYKSGPFWKQLHHANEWIFFTQTDITINAVCGTNLEQFTLSGTGLLTLTEYCTIKEPSVTIQGHRSSAVRNQVPVISTLEKTEQMENKTKIDVRLHYASNYRVQERELSQLQQVLTTYSTDSINKHDIHHYSVSWICVSLMVLCIGATLYKQWRKKKYSMTQQVTKKDEPQKDDIEMVTVWGQTTPGATAD